MPCFSGPLSLHWPNLRFSCCCFEQQLYVVTLTMSVLDNSHYCVAALRMLIFNNYCAGCVVNVDTMLSMIITARIVKLCFAAVLRIFIFTGPFATVTVLLFHHDESDTKQAVHRDFSDFRKPSLTFLVASLKGFSPSNFRLQL